MRPVGVCAVRPWMSTCVDHSVDVKGQNKLEWNL